MLVLGIETSGSEGSVALVQDNACLDEKRLSHTGRRHAQSLVLEIGELLRSHDLAPRDIEAVAVSRGPGSFTGLRVGMVCAKTFAYGTGCKFIAIDTFTAIAENLPAELTHVIVIEDAQRDELFVGRLTRDESRRWTSVSPIQLISTAEFLRQRTESDVITGPGVRKLDPIQGSSRWLSGEEFCLPRASVIASLGHVLIASNADPADPSVTDFWQALPFYLRKSAAEEKNSSASTRQMNQNSSNS